MGMGFGQELGRQSGDDAQSGRPKLLLETDQERRLREHREYWDWTHRVAREIRESSNRA